jgi:hypothetical protein
VVALLDTETALTVGLEADRDVNHGNGNRTRIPCVPTSKLANGQPEARRPTKASTAKDRNSAALGGPIGIRGSCSACHASQGTERFLSPVDLVAGPVSGYERAFLRPWSPLNRTKGSGCQAATISLMSATEEAAVHTAVAMFAIIMGVGIATSCARDLVRGRVDLSLGPFRAGEAGNDSLLWPLWLAEYGTAAALVAGGSGLLIAQGSLGCPDARTQYLSAIQLTPAARAIHNQRCTP